MNLRIMRLGQGNGPFSFRWPWEAERGEDVIVSPPRPLPPPRVPVASVDTRRPRTPLRPPGPEVQRPGTCPPGYIRRAVPPFDCLPPIETGESFLPPPIPIPLDPTPPIRAPIDMPITAPTPTPSLPPTSAPLVPTPTPTSGLPSMPFGLPMDSAPMVAPSISGRGFLGQVRLVRCP